MNVDVHKPIEIIVCASQFEGIYSAVSHRNWTKFTEIEMALMTMIARVVDGLPLVGTMQDDEQVVTTSIVFIFAIRFLIVPICLCFTVWQKCAGVSKSGEIIVPQIRSAFAAQMFHWNWSIFIPVSIWYNHFDRRNGMRTCKHVCKKLLSSQLRCKNVSQTTTEKLLSLFFLSLQLSNWKWSMLFGHVW